MRRVIAIALAAALLPIAPLSAQVAEAPPPAAAVAPPAAEAPPPAAPKKPRRSFLERLGKIATIATTGAAALRQVEAAFAKPAADAATVDPATVPQ